MENKEFKTFEEQSKEITKLTELQTAALLKAVFSLDSTLEEKFNKKELTIDLANQYIYDCASEINTKKERFLFLQDEVVFTWVKNLIEVIPIEVLKDKYCPKETPKSEIKEKKVSKESRKKEDSISLFDFNYEENNENE